MDRAANGHEGNSPRIVRRRVLFAHGFDPRGPGPYHALMAEEARPGVFEVGPRRGAVWDLAVDWPDGRAESRFEVLRWDDLVRAFWVRGPAESRLPLRALRVWGRAGVLAEAARDNRPFCLALLLPAAAQGLRLTAVLVATTASVVTLALLARILGASPAWGLAGLAALAAGPWLRRAVQRQLDLGWLSQCFDALARFRGLPADREVKLDAMADRIVAVAEEAGDEEVVVVGHSIGSLMAAAAVSRALKLRPDLGDRVQLVTLGQCLSIYGRLGGDPGWTRDLARLVASQVRWTDITSPADGASSGRWPPLRFSAHAVRTDRVRARSPRFHEALHAERLRQLRRDPRALHFQYLRLSDRPEVYDVRRVLAGPPGAFQ